jgi:hypothetical protein
MCATVREMFLALLGKSTAAEVEQGNSHMERKGGGDCVRHVSCAEFEHVERWLQCNAGAGGGGGAGCGVPVSVIPGAGSCLVLHSAVTLHYW